MNKRKRTFFSAFLAVLLIFSSLLTDIAYVKALSQSQSNPSPESEEMTEKMRENLYIQQEATSSEESELTSLLSGLGWQPKLTEEKKPAPRENEPAEKIEKEIYKELEKKNRVDVIIKLKDKENMENLFKETKKINKREEKIQRVIERLKAKSASSQKGLQQALSSLEQKGKVKIKKNFWINNSIAASVDADAIEELKQREDVKAVILDKVLTLPEMPVEESNPRLPEWGLEKINAPKVWGEYGIKGEGIVVGIMDTGVDGNHEALKHNYRGRDGNHQYSWSDFSGDNYETPADGHGHGTHVAGTAIGGGEGEPIGVAPEAEWIAAKIFNDSGATTLSAIHSAFEWFMAPGGDPSKAPHVVNNSWGNSNPYNTEFYEDVQAWLSAGIFPMFAAGNDGPGSETIGSPGSFLESFAIGATDEYDYIASFSSRGPVYWPDENGEPISHIKPDISAPGHRIYSAYPESLGRGKYAVLSGTSMATPHVTGAVALLLSAKPDLSVEEIKQLLTETARVEPHMGTVPNHSYGAGIVDIYRAVTEAAYGGTFTGSVTDKNGNPIQATISFLDEDVTVETNEDGTFNRNIREGTYQVRVEAFRYEPYEVEVRIIKDQTNEYHWQLTEAPRYTITGEIINKDNNEPVPFAFIRLKNTPLSAERTDQNGHFRLEDIPAGTYELQVTGDGIAGTTQTVEVNGNMELIIEAATSSNVGKPVWKTANNNNQRNSVSKNTISAEQLHLQWEYETGSKGNILFSTPAATEEQVILTTDRGWVISLDTATGEEQWSIRLGNTNRSTPTVEGESVFVSGGEDGYLYSLDGKTGRINWRKQIGQPAIYESPLYKDGVLYVGSGLTENPKLYAVNADTGEEIWSLDLGASSFGNGAIGETYLYIGTYENRTIRAIDPSNGAVVWTQTVEGEGFASRPVYSDGIVYAIASNFDTGSGTLYAFDGKTGEILWHVSNIGNSEFASPIVYEELVITSSSVQPLLRAFDKETGNEVWENDSVGTSLNNGSVSANGILFFTGTGETFYALDVYSGEIINRFTMPDYSSSGIPIVPGNVLVPNLSGIQSYVSAGVLKGRLTDEMGDAVVGTATVLETGARAETDENGIFHLSHLPGTYTVRISSYGYKQVTEEVHFVSGFSETKNYTLEAGEAGTLVISLKDKRTTQPLEGAIISLEGTPINGQTDENGQFTAQSVTEGTYEAVIELDGYATQKQSVTISANEENQIELFLQPYDIAVLNDWNGEMTNLLNNHGYFAVEKGWDIIDSINRYEVLILNGAYTSDGWKPDEEIFLSLIEAAKEADVDVIFADAWGGSYGSIGHLVDYLGDPKELSQQYDAGTITLEVDRGHPILEGYDIGDQITLIHNGDLTWFNGYSGIHLATIGSSEKGNVGSGIAYKAVSENSAHVLMSAHGIAPWSAPSENWSDDMVQILLNTVNYLQNAQFGTVHVTVQNNAGEPVEATLEVIENGMKLEKSSRFEFYLDPGEVTLKIQASGYETEEVPVTVSTNQQTEITVTLTSSDGSQLKGTIEDALSGQPIGEASVTLQRNGETIAQTETTDTGTYELNRLDEGRYTLIVEKEGYIHHQETVEIETGTIEKNLSLTPVPRIAVLEDYFSGRNFQKVFEEIGVPVTELTASDVVERIGEFDVVFVNEIPYGMRSEDRIYAFIEAADEAKTSLVFGDDYYTSSPIYQLTQVRNDPESRDRMPDADSSAGYIVETGHPIFKNAEPGEFIEIRYPSRSRFAYFEGYSGYPLAKIGHKDGQTYGWGMAYKPRTSESVELLMSGHGFSVGYSYDHYTEEGKQILIDAILWAAYAEFPVISGTVTDPEGNPLEASVNVIDEQFDTRTDPETGEFILAIEEGEYEIEVSAFGYETQRMTVSATPDHEPLHIVMNVDTSVGSIHGVVENEKDGFAVSDVEIEVHGYPRSAVTNSQGTFTIERLLPGTYTLIMKKEGFVEKWTEVNVTAGERKEVTFLMKPSPRVGIIGDYASSDNSLKVYLERKGYLPEDVNYTDTDKIGQFDLIIANSDYTSNKESEPDKDEFDAFVTTLDRERIPIIWTGHVNDRGGIRFMHEYENNPQEIFEGTKNGIHGKITENHPITQGFEPGDEFPIEASFGYYYGFDGYTGTTVADLTHPDNGRIGSIIAYGGRTIDSVEVLLANFTFSYYYNPSSSYFDSARERLLNNAILWALDHKEPLVGELHGQLKNNLGMNIQGTITVLETGKTVQTDESGYFFLGLPEGTYTLEMEAFGHETKEYSYTIVKGERTVENFVLTSHDIGRIKGTVRDSATGEPIEEARIAILNTPVNGKTDENGLFDLALPVGQYDVRITAQGYASHIVEKVEVKPNEETIVPVFLQEAQKIAVIATSTNANKIDTFLSSEGYEADYYTDSDLTTLIENIGDYALIIFNDKSYSTSEDQFKQIIEKSDEQGVSMIFTSQYGGGTIRYLRDYYGEPESVSWGFVPTHINVKVIHDHPLFSGIGSNEFRLLQKEEDQNQQYAVFDGYSGTIVGEVTHDDRGVLGSGIAYQFRTANSVHLLLSGLQVTGSYSDPAVNWTEEAKLLYMNAINWAMDASLGEITGIVTDMEGTPIPGATVSIPASGIAVTTDVNGSYKISIGTGEHEVKATARGFHEQIQRVEITEQGQTVELNFSLEEIEGTSLSGTVKNKATGNPIFDALVVLTSAEGSIEPVTAQTDERGRFTFTKLLPGTYMLKVSADGFMEVEKEISIGEEPVTVDLFLEEIEVAVLGDYKGQLTKLLNENELFSEETDWTVLNSVGDYKLIVVNTNKGSVEQIRELIEKAEEKNVSLAFLGTWGVEDGSIQLLAEATGVPELDKQGYGEGPVILKGDSSHPIFEGLSDSVVIHSEKSPYSTFKTYPGITLGTLEVDGDDKGTSIAYEFRSATSVHLLLSTFAVTNIIGPDYGWTKDGKRLFINAMRFAMDAEQQFPSVPVWDTDRIVTKDTPIMITGKASPRANIHIFEKHGNKMVPLTTVKSSSDGTFAAKLALDNGNHFLYANAENFKGTSELSEQLQVIVTGKPKNIPND